MYIHGPFPTVHSNLHYTGSFELVLRAAAPIKRGKWILKISLILFFKKQRGGGWGPQHMA